MLNRLDVTDLPEPIPGDMMIIEHRDDGLSERLMYIGGPSLEDDPAQTQHLHFVLRQDVGLVLHKYGNWRHWGGGAFGGVDRVIVIRAGRIIYDARRGH